MRRHHQLARFIEAQPLAEVRESALHGEGRRGEHHAGINIEQQFAKQLRHVDGGGLKMRAHLPPAAALQPEDRVAILGLHEELELLAHHAGALAQGLRVFGAFQPLQLAFHPVQRVEHAEIHIALLLEELLAIREGHAAFAHHAASVHPGRQRGEEQPRAFADHLRGGDDFRLQLALGAQQRLDVARQILETHVAEADAEVARRHILQLVRLIEDHHSGFRQNACIGSAAGLLTDRHVGKEQVMIHDDHVALGGAAAHLGDEAAAVIGAGLPEAGLASRVEFRPQRAGLGQIVDLGAIAHFRRLFPVGDGLVLGDLLESGEDRLVAQGEELVAAQVIRAALHVADAQRAEERLQKRHILKEELFLQILRAGGDDHAVAGGRAFPRAASR